MMAFGARAFAPAVRRGATPRFLSASVEDTVASSDVVVFSKSWCPFCSQTKALFESMDGVDATVVELDLEADGAETQAALAELTGQRTVPNVFIRGTHLGGNDDTQRAFASGALAAMLAAE